MKKARFYIFISLLTLGSLVAQEKKNILFICVDDLRPELNSFGAKHVISPNIDALAAQGRAFYNHYVNAPSCGPSRYTMLTGIYESFGNYKNMNAAFSKRKQRLLENPESVAPSMPEWFKRQGYTTISVGKVSHHPGGKAGKDWNDPNQVQMPNAWDKCYVPVGAWKTPKGVMHGLAHGEIRVVPGEMDVFQSEKGEDSIYPDGLITESALKELDTLKNATKPFFLAVGLIRPHLPFGAPKKYLKKYKGIKIPEAPFNQKPSWSSTWHKSGEFMKYNRWGKDPREDLKFAAQVKKHYLACVTYADTQIGKIVAQLKSLGLEENTIIVVWGDHGWSLGDHAIWGKHSLFEEALHSPLIIVDPSIPQKGKGTKAVVESVDIFPTLCDLTDIPTPEFIDGVSLRSLVQNPEAKGHGAYAYQRNNTTFRTDQYRLILKNGIPSELFDHTEDPYETKNIIGEHPNTVENLMELIAARDSKRN